ncbi:Hypothetical predicted protein [Mytilus galloprovincialis]|uniref:Uncharacterized protein n=1 Tax=Mytilus galloprovincialis TaxID=29158 RepID=A0A8B6CSQ8_MYTGA|nr:Hypothetical predicted protein [Mytilus galloprovincialis]
MLENAQNLSTRKLDKEKRSMSDRVAVTACVEDKDYSNLEKILFPYIHKNLGITDSVISSMKTTGIFKCEKPGL